ncbi:hypothetical protein NP233_g7658 [Leucocoprinus birnbaumii]|uniref:Uncharacterized protein n=1 Tax=Leucocoprinus birnbaumii TaxID=56174 RepID=A0AAD5VPK8_9AGAR|nr:hypothetical protein NP233_g7658 [Leucocoprinus birnbaumii]
MVASPLARIPFILVPPVGSNKVEDLLTEFRTLEAKRNFGCQKIFVTRLELRKVSRARSSCEHEFILAILRLGDNKNADDGTVEVVIELDVDLTSLSWAGLLKRLLGFRYDFKEMDIIRYCDPSDILNSTLLEYHQFRLDKPTTF